MCKRRSPSGGNCRTCTSISGTASCSAASINWPRCRSFPACGGVSLAVTWSICSTWSTRKTNLPMVIYENPAQTANPNATLAEALHLYQRGLLEEAAGDGCRGCSRIPWRPMTRRLPRSISSFHESAWDGSRGRFGGGGPATNAVGRRARPDRLCADGSRPAATAAVAAVPRRGWSGAWEARPIGTCLNQSWNCQLAPVTQPALGRDPASQSRSARLQFRTVQAAEPRRAEQRRFATDQPTLGEYEKHQIPNLKSDSEQIQIGKFKCSKCRRCTSMLMFWSFAVHWMI